MSEQARLFAGEMWAALDGEPSALQRLSFGGEGSLPSAFHVTDLAAASIGAAGLAVSELVAATSPATPKVAVDRRLASLWFGFSIHPEGWKLPPAWDPIAGDYRTADGWIRLHTNAPHHRAAALSVLEAPEDRAAVTETVANWSAGELEAAIVAADGCAAEMRTLDAWLAHPQGIAIAEEPLVAWAAHGRGGSNTWRPTPGRPLAGLRVLDLTRVLAGPIATRFLAGYGADVLRIDPPGWDEAGVVPEVTLGKTCVRLDLRDAADRDVFARLLAQAHVLVHGYRPGALDGLGFREAERRKIAPGLIDVSLCAYGWTGPWATRRGFDSLVQMSAGIAAAGQAWKSADKPVPLPVQALDHATGYLMAAAVVRALTRQLKGEGALSSRLSLARTARLLTDAGGPDAKPPAAPETADDVSAVIEQTTWGPARRYHAPVDVDTAPMAWDLPATSLGSGLPKWRSQA
jgi:crotonobetainyl-CoA:carnitine CoA-transferase CaiB-like acyl-CoA transferase